MVKKKISNTILLILFATFVPLYLIVRFLFIKPFAKIYGSIIVKKKLAIVNQCIEEVMELSQNLKYPEAIEKCDEALNKFQKHPQDDYFYLTIFIKKIILYASLVKYSKSEELMAEFEDMLKSTEYTNSKLYREYYFAKALLAENRDQLKIAEQYYLKTEKLNSENSAEINEIYFNTQVSLSEIHLSMGLPNKAINDLEKAMKFIEVIKNIDDKVYFASAFAQLLEIKADSNMLLGKYEESKDYYIQTLSVLEEANLVDLDYAHILVKYIDLCLKNEKLEDVQVNIEKAKEIFEQVRVDDFNIIYSEAIYHRLNRDIKTSIKILEDLYKKKFPFLHGEYYGRTEFEIISKISLWYSEIGDEENSLTYLKILNQELFKAITKSPNKLNDYEKYYFINSFYEIFLNVYELNDKFQTLHSEYRKELYRFHLLMKSIDEQSRLNIIPDIDSVNKQLPKDSVIIDIKRIVRPKTNANEITYFAFIIDKEIRIIKIDNSNKFETEFYIYYLKAIKRKAIDVKSYKNYWEQIAKLIPDKTNIYLSAEGIYNFINIENLLTPDNKYLFQKKNIHPFQNYFLNTENEITNNEAIIIANPKFEINNAVNFSNPPMYIPQMLDKEIVDLPFSEEEGKSIAKTLNASGYKVIEYYGEDANVKKVTSLNSPKILHIATHGFNFQIKDTIGDLTEWEHFNGILLSDSINTKDGNKYYNSNGLLYSKDIKELNLSNTKLAVISTCNSGSGLILTTGGIIGIQKVLFLAGAESLLVTLWEIEDKVTQEFMILFYSQWTKNEDIKESFNFAKSAIKEKYLYPFYWAGYRIINNSLLKILERKNDC